MDYELHQTLEAMFLRRSYRLATAFAFGRVPSRQRKFLAVAEEEVRARGLRDQNGESGEERRQRRGAHAHLAAAVPLAAALSSGAYFFTLDDASARPPADPAVSKILKAAKRGDAAAVEQLLSAKGADVDARHHLGWSALHVAAVNGRSDVVRALVKAGADPNLPEDYTNIYHTAREKGMHSLGTYCIVCSQQGYASMANAAWSHPFRVVFA